MNSEELKESIDRNGFDAMKTRNCLLSASDPLEGLSGSERPKRPFQGGNRENFLLVPAFFFIFQAKKAA